MIEIITLTVCSYLILTSVNLIIINLAIKLVEKINERFKRNEMDSKSE